MPDPSASNSTIRDFVYLDENRVRSVAAQLGIAASESDASGSEAVTLEQLFLRVEPALLERGSTLKLDESFNFEQWTPETFVDGRYFHAAGVVRLFDFAWLSAALGGLPAVLRKLSKLEMDALRNSEEGRRMSKQQLQQRSQENQVAITRVEEFKADELGEVVRGLYAGLVRVKVRPNPAAQAAAALVGAADSRYFYDSPAALSQKYGVEIDADWQVVGQLNVPKTTTSNAIPTGNRMEDSFEQIALLMNNAFRIASAPQFPAVSFTPIAIYRTAT